MARATRELVSQEANMRIFIPILALGLASMFATATPTFSADEPPAWAYPVNPPDFKPHPDDGILRRVPVSPPTYPLSQLRDRFIAPVWHPEDHPPLPPIVAQGRKPNVFACGFCHRADGPGGSGELKSRRSSCGLYRAANGRI